MKATVVRYRAHAGAAGSNAAFIGAVFSELDQRTPEGLVYLVLRLADDEFLHVSLSDAEPSPLGEMAAFGRFRAGVAERCIERPVVRDAELIGAFGVHGLERFAKR